MVPFLLKAAVATVTTARKIDPGKWISKPREVPNLLARNPIGDLDEEARQLSDSALADCLSFDKIEDKLRILFGHRQAPTTHSLVHWKTP